MQVSTLIRCAFRSNDAGKVDARAHRVDCVAGGARAEAGVWLGSQGELLRRIRTAAGGTQAEFDRLYLPVLNNYARQVRLLHAAPDGARAEAEGMLRLGMQVGFHALQASGGVIFSGGESAERRRMLESRWRYATFLAGLCVEACRAVGDSAIPTLLGNILSADCQRYLREGGDGVVSAMMDAIVDVPGRCEQSALRRIVDDVRRRVAGRGEAAAPGSRLVDVMRRLVRDGTWKVGERKARLWYGADGLYLVWKTAANEIRDLLDSERIQGLPREANALRDILARAGVIESNPQGGLLWTIRAPNAANALVAVKIKDPELLFAGAAPQPLPHAIGQAMIPDTLAGDR